MKRAYWITRIVGYGAGLAGLVMYLRARSTPGMGSAWLGVGAGLLILSFAGFFVSYALYLYSRLTKR